MIVGRITQLTTDAGVGQAKLPTVLGVNLLIDRYAHQTIHGLPPGRVRIVSGAGRPAMAYVRSPDGMEMRAFYLVKEPNGELTALRFSAAIKRGYTTDAKGVK